jgi:hypothetical protein
MEFERAKRTAKDGISKIMASAPSVPPQLGQLLMTMADMDPAIAMKETQQLLVSMARDNGVQQIGKLSTMIQDNSIGAELTRLNREVEMQVGQNELTGDPVMAKTTPSRLKAEQLSKDGNPRKRKAAYAISNIESMFPPKGMKSDPAINGKPVGIFDIMVGLDGGDVSELSRFELLRNLAAYSDLWPSKVDWVDLPTNTGIPIDVTKPLPQSYAQFRNYLLELDQWASSALKWDRSDPRTIDLIMRQVISNSASVQAQPPASSQPAQGQTNGATQGTQDQFSINFGS